MVPKSVANRVKIEIFSAWGWPWKHYGHRMPDENGPPLFFSPILVLSGRFEAPLWANLAPHGGPKLPKWRPKSMKNRCQNRSRKIDGKLSQKTSILKGSRTGKSGKNVELSSISAFRRLRRRNRFRTPKKTKKRVPKRGPNGAKIGVKN